MSDSSLQPVEAIRKNPALTLQFLLGNLRKFRARSKESLGTALSVFGASPWIGFVIGFSLSGTAMNAFGITPSLLLGVGISLVAIVLLMPIQSQKRQPLAVG